VHDADENAPLPVLDHATDPLGATDPSGPASVTTAVQIVLCPVTSDVGAHDTDVVLARSEIDIDVDALLPRCDASPAYTPTIDCELPEPGDGVYVTEHDETPSAPAGVHEPGSKDPVPDADHERAPSPPGTPNGAEPNSVIVAVHVEATPIVAGSQDTVVVVIRSPAT
jgi:hypothetical protein